MIKYFSRDDRKLETKFCRLSQIEADDGMTISDSSKSQLIRDGITIEKVIGTSVEGASEPVSKVKVSS